VLGISHGVTAKLCKCATPHRIFATRVFPNQLQAIVGLILVKELLMVVDEDAGVLSFSSPHSVVQPTNLQSIVGLILVKELLMVDEDAGVHIRDLRLRELPFMR